MIEKHLTETPWKNLAAKHKIKDAVLTRSLAAYGKADEKDFAGLLKAVKEIASAAETLKKDHKKEAEVADYLDEILKETKKRRGELELLAKKAEEEEGDKEDDEESKEYRKNLKSKLVSALSHVKSRAPDDPSQQTEPKPQLQFMAYVAAGQCAVVVAAKVGGGTRNTLKAIAGGASGGKFLEGECIFEKNVHTFVLETVPSGLAKKLAKALLEETGAPYKVRVRSIDGSVNLDSETDQEAGDDLHWQWNELKATLSPEIKRVVGGNSPRRDEILGLVREALQHEKEGQFGAAIDLFNRVRPLLEETAPGQQTPGQQTSGEPSSEPEPSYRQQVQAILPNLQRALKEQLGNVSRIRSVVEFMREKAGAGDFAAALKALETLRKLLPGGEGSVPPGPSHGPDFSKVNFEKIHLAWDSRKKEAQQALEALHQAILNENNDPEAFGAAENLNNILTRFNEGLGDTLDGFRSAETPEQQLQLAGRAWDIANRYLAYLESSPLVAHVERNPYDVEVDICEKLSQPLEGLQGELAKLMA